MREPRGNTVRSAAWQSAGKILASELSARREKKTHLDPVDEIALEVQAYNDNREPDDPILSYGQYVVKFGK